MSRATKSFQELTIRDNFMFGALMMDEEICRHTIELALGFPIERVSVVKERSMQFHSEYRGVRLDVFAKDAKHTRYAVEMQVRSQGFLAKRARYYHSQMDMELLGTGVNYEELADGYVIFICCFDPFGDGLYRYTVYNHCAETGKTVEDGVKTVYLSTAGKHSEQVPQELVSFLKYVKESHMTGREDEGSFVKIVDERIHELKRNRELGEEYMLLELMLRDERREGREEGREEGRAQMAQETVLGFLNDLGEISTEVRDFITGEKNEKTLALWVREAARAKSIEDFFRRIKELSC